MIPNCITSRAGQRVRKPAWNSALLGLKQAEFWAFDHWASPKIPMGELLNNWVKKVRISDNAYCGRKTPEMWSWSPRQSLSPCWLQLWLNSAFEQPSQKSCQCVHYKGLQRGRSGPPSQGNFLSKIICFKKFIKAWHLPANYKIGAEPIRGCHGKNHQNCHSC